jgi:hypothetical protein
MTNNTAAAYINNDFKSRTFSFQTISRNENSSTEGLGLLEWMDAQEIITLHQQADGEGDRAGRNIEFSLKGLAAEYYSLVKALIVQGAPRTFTFQVMGQSRSFNLLTNGAQESEVRRYLSKIFSLIDSEIRFKQVLRKMIVNQEKFEMEERLLFNSL